MIRILLSTELGKRRWSQADLARKTGIRASTIGDYYNELTDRINLRHFELICKALDCDLTDLLVYHPDEDTPVKCQRIKAGIEKLPAGDVKPFKGSPGTYRLRVGDWRILFSYPEDGTILIEKIGPRGGVYK